MERLLDSVWSDGFFQFDVLRGCQFVSSEGTEMYIGAKKLEEFKRGWVFPILNYAAEDDDEAYDSDDAVYTSEDDGWVFPKHGGHT